MKQILCIAAAIVVCLITVHASDRASAPDWPQFMGPDRNGVVEGTKLLSVWPTNGPKQVWTTNCGCGYAGPVVANGILVFMERARDKSPPQGWAKEETTRALDAMSGREIWKSESVLVVPTRGSYGCGPGSTPAIGGDKVVCVGIEGSMRCHEVKTGKVIWEKDLPKEFLHSKPTAQSAYFCSPLIVGDVVVMMVHIPPIPYGPSHRMVAWRLTDGQEVWSSPDFDNYGDMSPGFMMAGDIPTVICATRE